MILSYASDMCAGKGKSLMWSLVNELHRRNITVFATPMTPTGEAWDDYFFGQLPHTNAFVALFCPAYFESDKCKHELARAYKANVRILPLLFENLSTHILQMQPGWMGESPADVRLGNNVKGGVGQLLPEPGETFEEEWAHNVDQLATLILGLPLSSQLGLSASTPSKQALFTSPSKPSGPAAASFSTPSVRASASLQPASPTQSSPPDSPPSLTKSPQPALRRLQAGGGSSCKRLSAAVGRQNAADEAAGDDEASHGDLEPGASPPESPHWRQRGAGTPERAQWRQRGGQTPEAGEPPAIPPKVLSPRIVPLSTQGEVEAEARRSAREWLFKQVEMNEANPTSPPSPDYAPGPLR